jgi:hypothetical protein
MERSDGKHHERSDRMSDEKVPMKCMMKRLMEKVCGKGRLIPWKGLRKVRDGKV